MSTRLLLTLGDPDDGGIIAEGEIASFGVTGPSAGRGRPAERDELVITYSDSNLHSTLSHYQRDGLQFKKVVIRKVEIVGTNGSVRTLQSWEFTVVSVIATETGSHEGAPVHSATLVFSSFSAQGTVVGLEDQPFEDADPRLFAEHQVVEMTQPELARDDEQATAVILVCRNEWNTLNSHATGYHWFSA